MASIVIVGGGLAGLVCGWRLRRAGFEVEVLERGQAVGGRMQTDVRDGFRLEGGTPWVSSADGNLHAVARALGLAERLAPPAWTEHRWLRNGSLQPVPNGRAWALGRRAPLSAGARLRLLGLGADLLRHTHQLDPLHPERAAALDDGELASGLRRRVGDEAFDGRLAPLLATRLGGIEDLGVGFGLLALRQASSGALPEAFEGGSQQLPEALAAGLPVRTGVEVLSVETETAGARVRYRAEGQSRSVVADAAVVAVPGCDVAALCPKLTPAERGFFEQLVYAPGIVAHLFSDVRLPVEACLRVGFPADEGFDLAGVDFAHHAPGAAPPGAALLRATLGTRATARLWQASDAAIADCVLENLAATPLRPPAPSGFAVERFPQLEPRFVPRSLRRLERFLGRLERSPRLAFAGDYLVAPSAEGAAASGMRAATEVARALDPSAR